VTLEIDLDESGEGQIGCSHRLSAAYPAASVELRSRPEETNQDKEDEMSEDSSTSEVRTEEERTEDISMERPDELPNYAGSLRVEDRAGANRVRSLADAFRQRGFPNEVATVEWGEFRTATFGGTIDDLSPVRRDGVALGADKRYAYPAFQSIAVDSATTSVQVFRQDSRTLPAGADVTRPIGGTTTKPEVTTAGTVTNVPLQQVASIESGVPNLYLEQSSFNSLIEVDLRLSSPGGLDDLVMTGIAGSGFESPGTNPLLVSIRNAMGTIQDSGYNPDTLLLPPTDAIALDTLRVAGTASEDYVFAPAQLAPRQIYGLNTRIITAGTAAVVCDSQAFGKLYASPLSLSRFEENAGATNTSTVRLEGNAAFGVERPAAAIRIAFS
jgi:hypothetical protein